MLERDCDGEIPRDCRLRANNLAPGAQERPMRNSNRQFYSGALPDQKGAGEENAAKTDILRVSAHFPVTQLDRDRQVKRITNVPTFPPLRGDGGHCYSGRLR
jgi:hypothetical protein